MARRNQRKGDHLATSDYSGCTTYASRLVRDYWGQYGEYNEIVLRNLQEIAVPLEDPYPVKIYNGPQYEQISSCQFEIQPQFIGKTTIPFPVTQVTNILNLNPAIPDMSIGCSFIIYPPPSSGGNFITTQDGDPITTGTGDPLVISE